MNSKPVFVQQKTGIVSRAPRLGTVGVTFAAIPGRLVTGPKFATPTGRGRTLAIQPRMLPGSAVIQRTTEVDVPMTQKMSGGEGYYNHPHTWNAKFAVDIVRDSVVATVKIQITAEKMLFGKWSLAVATKWNERFCLKLGWKVYPIEVRIVQDFKKPHHIVNLQEKTANMTNWGPGDENDVTHEVGHMIGNKDEYFTVDDEVFTTGVARKRVDPVAALRGDNIMNNPRNNPIAAHYSLIKEAAETELKVPKGTTTIIPEQEYTDYRLGIRNLELKEKRVRKDVRAAQQKLEKHHSKMGAVMSIYMDRTLADFYRDKEQLKDLSCREILTEYEKLIRRYRHVLANLMRGADELIKEEESGNVTPFKGIMAEKYPDISSNPARW